MDYCLYIKEKIMLKKGRMVVVLVSVLVLTIPVWATQLEEGFTSVPWSNGVWEKMSQGATHPGIDFINQYMYVGNDGGGTGYKTKAENGFAWSSGVATFWVKDWGAGAIFGLSSISGALSLGLRNDVYNTNYASVFINNTWYQESSWQWPASWSGTVSSIVQIAWDNLAGTVTFRFYNNSNRSVAPGSFPATWHGEATYSLTPTRELMYLFAYAYGGPDTYFEYFTVKPTHWLDENFSNYTVTPKIWQKTNPGVSLPAIDYSNQYMYVGNDTNGGTGYKTKVENGYAWSSGVATFWVKDWGAGAIFGLSSTSGALNLGFRNDVYNTNYASVFINGTWYQESSWQWPASWSGPVASIVQVAWDNVAGTVTFRFYDNTSRSVSAGNLPAAWQGEVTYTFTPTNEFMQLYTYSYGAPYTYFEYICVKPSVVFTPGSLYLSGPTPITMSCATPNAVIYYTTDGSEPTTSSSVYGGPVTVCDGTQTTILKAMAMVPGGKPSGFTTHQYTVSLLADKPTDLTRGHHLLVKRGLQIQAMAFPRLETGGTWVGYNPSRFAASNFTTLNLWSNPSLNGDDIGFCLGNAPGIPWGRVAINGAESLTDFELPYLSNMVDFQVYVYPGDDKIDLSNPANIQAMQNWYALNRSRYPDVINHDDQSPGKSWCTYTNIRNYVLTAQPDMLLFCEYPFNGEVHGNSPKGWYEKLLKYRQHGLEGLTGDSSQPIPYGVFLQTSSDNGHIVSESEMFLNQFSAWAFGYKFVSAYVYTTPFDYKPNYSILFNGYGDTNWTTKFVEIAEVNRQSRNLGPALVRLLSTEVRFCPGRHKHWWGTEENSTPSGMNDWVEINAANPYLYSVGAENLGGCNDGCRGDVIVGFFKPLHESYDGPNYTNQKYFMVTNGLINQSSSSLAGSARQKVRLYFNFGSSGITSLQRLSRLTGEVETLPIGSAGQYDRLIWISGTQYYMDIILDGGQGDLFKYNTGAPFVGINDDL
jgi:hypothetical protein